MKIDYLKLLIVLLIGVMCAWLVSSVVGLIKVVDKFGSCSVSIVNTGLVRGGVYG